MTGAIVIQVDAAGDVRTLWTDAFPLADLGPMRVERASTVEFNDGAQQWEVRFPGADGVAFEHASREVCLSWERDTINARLLA